MSYNQSWSGNRGRSRGLRGCGRSRRGGGSMHYRGGPTFHRSAPPLLNSPEPFYNPGRFRGTQEVYSHLYSHPLNQETSWSVMRNRIPFNVNSRQGYQPAARVQPPNRSSSPLPGSEEYMQKNICEKSAFLKRELELEGPCFNNALSNFDLSDSDFQRDNTNNNFCDNAYQKNDEVGDKSLQATENVPSPRRNKKPRQLSQRLMSVEEIHEKIINHISSLSHGKKINLVNLPGPSGYDMAIQEITRQKRMELSKALRDICNNKFKETEDSSQVINSIIPDFDIKIEELPRELVEQLSSTLNENVTERIHNMCIDPDLMFQQAAEMLNDSIDLEKNIPDPGIDKDFNYSNFASSGSGGRDGIDLELQNVEESSLSLALQESINQTDMLNFQSSENCQASEVNFNQSEPLNFNMSSSVNYAPSKSFQSSYDIQFTQDTCIEGDILKDSHLYHNKSNAGNELYSPGHEPSNSNFQEIPQRSKLQNINTSFGLIDIQERNDILLPSNHNQYNSSENLTSDVMPEEAELSACLAQTNSDLNFLDVNNSDKECLITNDNEQKIDKAPNQILLNISESPQPLKNIEECEINNSTETSTYVNDESLTFSHSTITTNLEEYVCENTSETSIEKKFNALDADNKENTSETKDSLKDVNKAKDQNATHSDQKLKEDLDLSSKKKSSKDKKNKSKIKNVESPKKILADGHQERKQENRKKSKHGEDELSRKSLEKESFDRSDRKQLSNRAQSANDYTNDDDVVDRKKHDRRQEDKKLRGKYDDDYYRSDKHKYDTYQQPYDDGYRKRYKDGSIDDDKHRRSDHSKYREFESDYHYSKYSTDIDEGRNSKRYYQDKVSVYPYRQDYDYPYHKYDYPPSEYHQRQDSSYPQEEYDQKQYYSKSHKNKHRKHAKKHKRHRDHSSGSNVSSSGSEKNSTTSSNYKSKQIVKPTESHDSSEEGPTNRYPKTSLKERIQALCKFKPELISPKIAQDPAQTFITDNVCNGSFDYDMQRNTTDAFGHEAVVVKVEFPTEQETKSYDESVEKCSKIKSDGEEDLKPIGELETSEGKKYSHRPWKSPGEKKFMMEHLNQNPVSEEEEGKTDTITNSIENAKDVIRNISQFQQTHCINEMQNDTSLENVKNCELQLESQNFATQTSSSTQQHDSVNSDLADVTHSAEVTSTSESTPQSELKLNDEPTSISKETVKIEVCNTSGKSVLSTYTQTDSDKDHCSRKMKKDSSKDRSRESYKEKPKPRQNSFTQTIVINAAISTQTSKLLDVGKNKTTQTDNVENAKETQNEVLDVKSIRRKRYIDKMFEIDREIHKLVQQRQTLYNLLNFDSDSEKEVDPKISSVGDFDERKQKRTHKEKVKNIRETKPTYSELSSSKQKSIQNSPKPNATKRVSQKIVTLESKIDYKEKVLDALLSAQHISRVKSKMKRGRPKRSQDKNDFSNENIPEKTDVLPSDGVIEEQPKKACVKEEIKSETKSKLKEKMESNRKRKNKDNTEHKPLLVDVNPSKRHKGESCSPVQKEVKTTAETPIDAVSESEPPLTAVKPRKKDRKPESQQKGEEQRMIDVSNVVTKDAEDIVNTEKQLDCENARTTEEVEENKSNDSAANIEKPIEVKNPETSPKVEVEIKSITVPEVSNSAKKKKRRLSGMLDYRKKKKKSRNKNKKTVPTVNSNIFSTKSAVNVTRFSLTQLEEMRNEIRNKKVTVTESNDIVEDTIQETDNVSTQSLVLTSSITSDEGKDSNEKDIKSVSSTDKSTSDLQDCIIEFKDFNGAILVIKVIETTVLAASDKGQLLYFDMVNGNLLKVNDLSKLAVTSLVVTKSNEDHFIYAGSLDSSLSIVNFNLKEIVKQETLSEPIQCMESSWSFIFVGSDRGSITRYDLNMDKVVDCLKVSTFNILMIKASQEGPRKVLIVAMRNSPVCVRDAISGLLLRTMQTSFSPTVYTLLIDKNLIYCGTSQHDILVYSFEDGQLVLQHEATKSKGVVCMQIVGNLLFAGCYNGNIYVYNTNNTTYLGIMNGPGGLLLSMEIVQDKIIVGTKSSNFKAWKIPQQFVDQM